LVSLLCVPREKYQPLLFFVDDQLIHRNVRILRDKGSRNDQKHPGHENLLVGQAHGAWLGSILRRFYPVLLTQDAVVQLLATPICGSLKEGDDEWMGLFRFRSELRLKECCDEEAVCRRFDCPHFTTCAAGGHRESRLNRSPFEIRIYFEIAEK